MLAEAKKEAERIIKDARERQERLVGEEEVTKQAERAAEDIVEDARAREREIRLGRRGLRRRDPQHARGQPVEVHRSSPARARAPAGQGRTGRSRLISEPARPRLRASLVGIGSARWTLTQVRYKLQVARALLGTGIAHPERPDKTLRSLAALHRWGPSSAAAYSGGAIRFPDRAAIIDDRGTLTFAEMHRRTNALAHVLADAGIGEQDSVAIMCRNDRGFVEATVACAKLGAGALYLNTMFAGPQITDVLAREAPAAVIYDEEFAELVAEGAAEAQAVRRLERAGHRRHLRPTLEQLIATADTSRSAPAGAERSCRDSHLGDDRRSEGGIARAARHAGAGGGAVLEDPAEGARDDGDRRAAVSLVGLCALHARSGAVDDARAAAQVRPRGHPQGGRPSTARAPWRSCR